MSTPSPLLAVVLATGPEALVVADHTGALQFMNASARQLLARCPDGLGRVLADARAGLAPGGVLHVRVPASGEGSLRAVVLGLDRGFGVLLREEAMRDGALHSALVGLGLSPSQARLAVRVARGWSNATIAHAFGVTEASVKGRLQRVFRRLGVRRRSSLAVAVEDVARRINRPHDPVAERESAGTPPPEAVAALAELAGRLDTGLLVLDRDGHTLAANPAADPILGPGGLPPTLQPRPADGPGTARFEDRGGTVRVRWWPAGPDRLCVEVWREQLRAEELATLLTSRYGLMPRVAAAAVLIGRGRSNAEVATELRVSEGLIRAWSSIIYAGLGVEGRVGVAALLADLQGVRMR
jgi:DNA-binding NarL/FixJ family response regulator